LRVDHIRIEPSPDGEGRVRLLADVTYADRGAAEAWWFEVPATHADDLSETGSPWVAALLPLAATLGEPLEIAAPVDPELGRGAREVLATWADWYAFAHEVEIRAEEGWVMHKGTRSAAFFSGGVDSFHTALTRTPLDELIFVGGFDLPRQATEATATVRRSLQAAGEDLGIPLVFVRTNWRETRAAAVDWELMGHGALLAAVGLALESRYARVWIPTSCLESDRWPWGSDPRTDPRLSTSALRIEHDGQDKDRHERAAVVAESETALAHLRVCWSSPDGGNCGRCEKCLLSMLMMEVVAGLERCPTLPDRMPPSTVRRLRIDTPWDARRFRAYLALARPELAAAIETALVRSARASRWRAWLDRHPRARPLRGLLLSGRVPAPRRWPSRLAGTAYPDGRGWPAHDARG